MKKIILLACIALTISACKKNKTVVTPPAIAVGSTYQGSIIFYVDATGKHGLIAAPSNQTSSTWGCVGTNTDGIEGTEIGKGQANTNVIVGICPKTGTTTNAANICNDLKIDSYDDWYLPSKGELNLLYTNLYLKSKGSFSNNTSYWSSTAAGDDSAVSQLFASATLVGPLGKDQSALVRAIRSF